MNNIIIATIIAMIIAQFLKLPMYYIKTGKIDWRIMFSTGAMPSSHTASVVCAATTVGLISGFESVSFGIMAVVSGIVIHDAVKVRSESGKQAMAINVMMNEITDIKDKVMMQNSKEKEVKLKELIGHTYVEAVSGLMLGIIVGYGYYYLIAINVIM